MKPSDKINEGQPADYNREAVDSKHPAKTDHAQHKIDIVQSELGREQGQTPADEHIDPSFSQIDKASAGQSDTRESGEESQDTKTAGYMNDATSADRDTGTNNDDNWDENSSRSARHK